ncbi:MAG: SagB family peptide dehydrogenase [Xanthobacteraceae bacterium]
MRAPAKKKGRRAAPPSISARLVSHIALAAGADGSLAAGFGNQFVPLGKYSAAAVDRAQALGAGLPLTAFALDGRTPDQEIDLLVRRLARRGLLEYRLGPAGGAGDQVVIEPQVADYWPQLPKLDDADVVVLSRFAYLRRRGDEMVLESPRAGALFRIGDPTIAAALARLATPQQIRKLRRQDGFPGRELLALLLDCRILFRIDPARPEGLRLDEGDDDLVLWDFHDLLFHTRTTEGRQANPLGGTYPFAGVIDPPPAVRPRWPGRKIDLRKHSAAPSEPPSPFARLLHQRHSTRSFDDQNPITLTELARFLDTTARIQAKWKNSIDPGGGGPVVGYAARPYPTGGSAYELELYLTVANCEGLARGFYHYDADLHALVPIDVRTQEFDALMTAARFAMDAPGAPQVLVTIAARFGRTAWKYSSIAYALILKDVGVLLQSFYLMATDMGLGGCAIGSTNIDLFAKMTGLDFHVEGPTCHFALGRATPGASD